MKPNRLKRTVRGPAITEKQGPNETGEMGTPNFPKRLFWDSRYERIDWQECYRHVIERVLERGDEDEWRELIRFYGLGKVINTIRFEYMYLMDFNIDRVCAYFNLKPEALKCYRVKQIRTERFGNPWL